jgi:hypothetical protein
MSAMARVDAGAAGVTLVPAALTGRCSVFGEGS